MLSIHIKEETDDYKIIKVVVLQWNTGLPTGEEITLFYNTHTMAFNTIPTAFTLVISSPPVEAFEDTTSAF